MISVFIFVIIMTASVAVFASHIKAHAYAREVQKNLENAQFAFNFIGKTLRTSAIAAGSYDDQNVYTAYTTNEIYVHDYSQDKCFHFEYDSTEKAIFYTSVGNGSQNGIDIDLCGVAATYTSSDPTLVGPVKLTTGDIKQNTFTYQASRRGSYDFSGIAQVPATIGHVTMSAAIVDETVDAGHVWIQTSVSLRDYPGELSF